MDNDTFFIYFFNNYTVYVEKLLLGCIQDSRAVGRRFSGRTDSQVGSSLQLIGQPGSRQEVLREDRQSGGSVIRGERLFTVKCILYNIKLKTGEKNHDFGLPP